MRGPIPIVKNESTAALRRVPIWCVDATDGMTPEPDESGNQPEISVSCGAKTTTGIGVLLPVDAADGDYYAELTQEAVNLDYGTRIEVSYKSANTAWDKVLVVIVPAWVAAAPAATALSTAQWTNGRAAYLDNLSAGAAALEATAQSILSDTSGNALALAALALICTEARLAKLGVSGTLAHSDAADTYKANVSNLAVVMQYLLNKMVTTDNEDGTKTVVLYDDDSTTPLKTWTFTTATGTRGKAT